MFEAKNDKVICEKKYNSEIITNINNFHFCFCFLKLYEEAKIPKNYLDIIQKEPIDIVMKYIDLTNKKLNRLGIKQIYKNTDNEELKFSIRNILMYIPWIRKIHIISFLLLKNISLFSFFSKNLMPNNKVLYFKSSEDIYFILN